ncbi:MAG: hypothetical protein RBT49_14310 [Bacteroidales bacterium]|nr:hypothetical protein [Bacteroidales bacterium]
MKVLLCVILICKCESTLVYGQHKDDVRGICLYENSNNFLSNDYRINQSIVQGTRFLSFSTGVAYQIATNTRFEGPVYPVSIVSGVCISSVFGVYYGYKKGVELNRNKNVNPKSKVHKYTIGHEFQVDYTFINDDVNVYNSHNHALLIYLQGSKIYLPAEIRIRKGISDIEVKSNKGELNFDTLGLEILYNSIDDLLQFYYGFSIGYTWGNYSIYDDYNMTYEDTKEIKGYSFSPIGGITLNLYDVSFIRLESKYVFSQVYSDIKKITDSDTDKNYNLSMIFGTYLF